MPDILAETMGQANAPAPALSATSDAPTALPTPPVDKSAEATDSPQTGEVESQPGEGRAPVQEAKPDNTPPEVKREITKERNRRRAAEDLAAQNQARLDQALKALEAVTAKPEVSDPRPSRDRFDDPDAYDTALEQWATRRATEQTRADEAQRRQAEAIEQRNKAVIDTYNERREAFVTDHPDYAEVVEADDVHFTIPMTYAIVNDEDGPAIAYHLANNPEELARISKLGEARQATEIGRLAAKLARQPIPVKADPMKPVGARSSATTVTPENETMDQYAARRMAEMNKGRRPFIAGNQVN